MNIIKENKKVEQERKLKQLLGSSYKEIIKKLWIPKEFRRHQR